ncbi:hypothetical protein AR457_13230 [Streptomyces agglomeratus]|uniref:Uncharacterized protein n=1 Tax=Streptomyces agglomeratus TaxID=285458 RepID=A0A1E5P6X4_9ACTN|nr:hypothetical protein [Streptomyces agglomeratus]OEJ25282.1 hypothetical protein AS594_13060 [Streptomyces agglomeratus]OEJ40684.1 hypothetical protein BGK70_23420 [Streptomyces agglomeratus]OEJ44936.1 hypothetical protein AR457_13230 [Streptomyces agglomeratus]OEJ53229.1 hypothetical protein BGK72_23040 [Streptomyces agglomeratus]OEJ60566.1 hypothetical protein BGM19_23750 [Streptomyces agglomeratus]
MPDVNVTLAMTQFVPLAADKFDKNKVTPGVLGFLVFAALAVGVWMLMKSMNRHMGKVNFEEAPDPAAEREKVAAPASGSASAAGSASAPAPEDPAGDRPKDV